MGSVNRHTYGQTSTLRRTARSLLIGGLTLGVVAQAGCAVASIVGVVAENARRTGTSNISAQYRGLQDKSYAVVCTADRVVQAAEPGLVSRIVTRVNERIALNANASHFIRSQELLAKLYNTPHWHAMAPSEVADMLGVERLVWIDLNEYRLNEPGNQYIWDGVAAGTVLVYESDSGVPDDPIFERRVQVRFPDASGYMQSEISGAAVTTELSNRFVNRVSWLFYDHEEPNNIAY